jgi:hypothetical protein
MTGPESLHLSLDLCPNARPVRGRLRLPGRPDRDFAGWTELFAALEAALASGRDGQLPDNSPTSDRL